MVGIRRSKVIFLFLPQRQANFVKMPYLHGCISESRCAYFHSGVCFLLADLSCLQWYNLATWVPHSWNKSSCSACVNLHCQLRIRKGICFDWELRDFGIWVFICFQQLSTVPVWTLKAAQGSVSKSFCALEFPSTMVYKEMFRTALFCYLWVAGSTICQQARRVSIWRFAKMSFPGFVDKS